MQAGDQQPRKHAADDESADMRLPCNARRDHRHQEVDQHPNQHRTNIDAYSPVHHQNRGEQAEQRAGRAICGGHPSRRRAHGPHHQSGAAAQSGQQVQRKIRPMPHHAFQHGPHAPQSKHVEQDVPQRGRLVQEHRGDEGPRVPDGRGGQQHAGVHERVAAFGPDEEENRFDGPHHDADRHDGGGDDRVAVAPPVSQRSGGEQILERWGIGKQTESLVCHSSTLPAHAVFSGA